VQPAVNGAKNCPALTGPNRMVGTFPWVCTHGYSSYARFAAKNSAKMRAFHRPALLMAGHGVEIEILSLIHILGRKTFYDFVT